MYREKTIRTWIDNQGGSLKAVMRKLFLNIQLMMSVTGLLVLGGIIWGFCLKNPWLTF
jgi:hypothetical protein